MYRYLTRWTVITTTFILLLERRRGVEQKEEVKLCHHISNCQQVKICISEDVNKEPLAIVSSDSKVFTNRLRLMLITWGVDLRCVLMKGKSIFKFTIHYQIWNIELTFLVLWRLAREPGDLGDSGSFVMWSPRVISHVESRRTILRFKGVCNCFVS